MSLRWRIALAMAAMTLFATTSFGLGSYRATRSQLLFQVDQSLRTPPLGSELPPDAYSPYEVQLVNADGTVVRTSFDSAAPLNASDLDVLNSNRAVIHNATVDGREYRVRTIGRRGGGLQLYRSLEETNRALAGVRIRLALLAAAITALAALIGWLVADRVTAPLRRLTAAAERVAETGDLEEADSELEHAAHPQRDEVGRLAVEFNRMIRALRRSRQDQQRLVQDAGHELRTPLTSLRTNIAILARFPDLTVDQRQQILGDLGAETEELTELVNEVVAIASGALDDETPQRVDLVEVAHEVADRFRRRTDREISVTGVAAAPVVARRRAVHRAASCLVENAAKFDGSGSPIDIVVGPHQIDVLDRGPGLGDADTERLFDRFYRAESSRAMPGSGLGLSIVRDVSRSHGGTVRAQDRDGGGAEIGFTVAADAGVAEIDVAGDGVAGTDVARADVVDAGVVDADVDPGVPVSPPPRSS